MVRKARASPAANEEGAPVGRKGSIPPLIKYFLPGLLFGWAYARFNNRKEPLNIDIPDDDASSTSTRRPPGSPASKVGGVRQKSRGGSGTPRAAQGFAGEADGSEVKNVKGELKMVLVVRQDLKMGGGKVAAQCAHAAVGTVTELIHRNKMLLRKWEDCGQPKIVLTCKDLREMNNLQTNASRAGIPTFVVTDAGRTQVAAGSKTVLAVGPAPRATVDQVTGHLPLLK